jgi:hypothetical protein
VIDVTQTQIKVFYNPFFLLDNPFGHTNHEWTLGQTLAKDSTNFLKQCALRKIIILCVKR